MFDAVIFDLDGTLIDTERLAMTATIAAFEAMGYQIDQDFCTIWSAKTCQLASV